MNPWLRSAVIALALGVASAAQAVGLNGYDPVAYLTANKAIKGTGAQSAAFRGETYWFATAQNRDAFAANPEKYLPQYGGYCAWAVAQGQLAPGDPTVFKVVDGKLYFNVNREIAARWEKDIPGFIRAGDANWPKLRK
jgi:YHS domain-containing protein